MRDMGLQRIGFVCSILLFSDDFLVGNNVPFSPKSHPTAVFFDICIDASSNSQGPLYNGPVTQTASIRYKFAVDVVGDAEVAGIMPLSTFGGSQPEVAAIRGIISRAAFSWF